MYVLGHCFNIDAPDEADYYLCITDDGKCYEVYDFYSATVFRTAKDAIDWSKENTTFADHAIAVKFEKEKERFDKWAQEGMIRREIPIVDKEMSRTYNNESPKQVLEWHIAKNTTGEFRVRYEDYKTWPDLYTCFEHLWSVKGRRKELLTVEMAVKSDAVFETFKTELKLALTYITCKEDGAFVIPIFDHHCGAGGNFVDFYYKSDDNCWIEGRFDTVFEGNLRECFEYWKKERFYD